MPGAIGGESANLGASGDNSPAPQSSVSDPGPGDESFAFPGDFESVGDEPLGGDNAAPQSDQPSGETPPAEPPQPAQAQPGQRAQAPAAKAQPSAQQQPAQRPAAQAPPAQPARQQGAPQQPSGPPGPQQLVERLAANRDAIVNDLATNRFKVELTKAELDGLNDDAVKALPAILSRLGANLYYEMAITSLNQINNLVPQLATRMVESVGASNNAENQFFSHWTNLDRNNAEHSKTVNFFANTFRQQNPNATPSEAIEAVGKMVSAYLGIALPVRNGNGGNAPQRPGAPRSPAPNGARPFAPAGGGGRPTGTPAQTAQDPWSGMGADFD